MIVAPFSKTVLPTTGPTADRRTMIDAIEAIRPAGGTAILDAVAEAARSVGAPETRRAIVLITDGYDENSTTSFDDALAAVKQSRVTVYVRRDRRHRRHLDEGRAGAAQARQRNRRPVLPSGERRPARNRPRALADDVQNRYLLTYTPSNQTIDGSWRSITVSCGDPPTQSRRGPGISRRSRRRSGPPSSSPRSIRRARTSRSPPRISEVVEDGVAQHIDAFHEATQPVSIVLALDASGSMRKREADVIASAREFVGALRPEDTLAVVHFADRAYLRARPVAQSGIRAPGDRRVHRRRAARPCTTRCPSR